MTRLLIAFTLIFALPAFAHAAKDEPANLCEAALRPGFEAWAALVQVVGPYTNAATPNVQFYEMYVGLADNPSVRFGHMNIEFEGDLMHVGEIFLDDGYKRRGVSQYLFAKALELFPKANKVSGTLVFDNASAFNEELKRTGSLPAAFKATPFYKAFAKLGFSQIDFEKTFYLQTTPGLEMRVLTLQRAGPAPAIEEFAKPPTLFPNYQPKPSIL